MRVYMCVCVCACVRVCVCVCVRVCVCVCVCVCVSTNTHTHTHTHTHTLCTCLVYTSTAVGLLPTQTLRLPYVLIPDCLICKAQETMHIVHVSFSIKQSIFMVTCSRVSFSSSTHTSPLFKSQCWPQWIHCNIVYTAIVDIIILP